MYWTITLLVSLGGLAACWAILSAKWNKVACTHDPVGRVLYPRLIGSVRVMEPWLPGDPGYLDLKFSVLRHAFVFGVSAVVLCVVGYGFWGSVIGFVNLLYAWLPISRYRYRKKLLSETAARNRRDLREHPEDAEGFREILRLHEALIRDSFVVVAYSVIAAASLYLLLFLDVPAAPAAPATQTDPPRAAAPAVTAPPETEPRPVLRQLPKPDHGHIFERLTIDGLAPFSVTGSGDIYLVLDPIDLSASTANGASQSQVSRDEDFMELRVFIRSGMEFETDVPLGEYEVYYATGDAWYGEKELFGPETQYYKCDGTFDFTEDSRGYNGWTLTLTTVYNGNLDTDSIPAAVFPK